MALLGRGIDEGEVIGDRLKSAESVKIDKDRKTIVDMKLREIIILGDRPNKAERVTWEALNSLL
jgi:hypothetical protein